MQKPHSVSSHLLHRKEAGGGEARALRTVPSDVLLTGSLITCLEAGSGSTRMARCWLSCCRHSEGPFLQASLTVIGSRSTAVPQHTCLPTSTLMVRLWEQWAGRPVSRDPAQHWEPWGGQVGWQTMAHQRAQGAKDGRRWAAVEGRTDMSWWRDEAAGTDLTALTRGLCWILGTGKNCWQSSWWEAPVVTTVVVAAAEMIVTVSLLWARPHSKCSVFSSHDNYVSQELLTPLYRENWAWRSWVIC